MYMHHLLIVTLVLMALPVAAIAEIVTTAPLEHLRATYELLGVEKILKLEVDINNDGLKEVLLAPLEPDEDGDEIGWYLYLAKANGQYVLAGESTKTGIIQGSLPSFRRDRYWAGNIPEIGRHGLLVLKCGSGGQAKCQLHAIIIDGGAWKDVLIGDPVDAETGYGEMSKRFPAVPAPPIQELKP